MKVSVEDLAPCRKRVRVEIPSERVDQERATIVREIAATAKVPGFRPGRAPADMIERRYGKAIAEEWADALTRKAYHEGLRAQKIETVSVLEVEAPPPARGKDAVVSFTVDVMPQFETPEYKGLKIKNERAPVSDADVQETVDRIRASTANYRPVEGRPAREKDLIQADFTATLDGQPLEVAVPEAKPMSSGKGFWLQTDPDAFLGALGVGLIGASVGETRTVPVTFDSGFHMAALRGRTVEFQATITGLREQSLPEMDENFFKRIGVEDETNLRARIREGLEATRQRDEALRRRNEAGRMLINRVSMDLPASVIEERTQHQVYRTVRASAARGVGQQEIVQNKEEIYQSSRERASDGLKLRYILHRIADAEKIQATQEEVAQQVQLLAEEQKRAPGQTLRELTKNGGLQTLMEDIRAEKAMEWVLANARIEGEEVAGPPEAERSEEG